MQQKRQHYVPRSYLELFRDKSEKGVKVHALSLKTQNIFTTNPANILAESDFYTITGKNHERILAVENSLTNIEGAFINVFRNPVEKRTDT